MFKLMCIYFPHLKIVFYLSGVLGGTCGELTIRLRPSLIFQPKHAEIYLDALRKTLKEI